MRAAVRDGSWDVFVGQLFTEFRRDLHVVTAFKPPSWWTRLVSNDPGFADPSVWTFLAKDQDGRLHCYKELTFYRTAPSEQARKVRQALEEEGVKCERFITGMDAFIGNSETGKSTVDYYGEGGLFGFMRPIHGAGSRKERAVALHQYLDYKSGKPRLQIHSCCEKLIETIPSLPADMVKREQVQECAIDHWYDALTYGICAWTVGGTDPTPLFKPGTLGDILDHASELEDQGDDE
jgi:hypothetical protein